MSKQGTWFHALTRAIIASLLTLAFTFGAEACTYHDPPGPFNAYCEGDCPSTVDPQTGEVIIQICKKPVFSGGCTCAELHTIIWFKSTFDFEQSAAFGLNRVGLGSGPGFWAVNAEYGATLTALASFQIDNLGEWGSGTTDLVPAASGGGMVLKLLSHPSDPSLREVDFTSVTIQIPSFLHSHWAPTPTGVNYLVRDPDHRSYGVVNTETGEITARLYTRLLNDQHSMEDTLVVVIDLDGVINASTGDLVSLFAAFGFDDGPPFVD